MVLRNVSRAVGFALVLSAGLACGTKPNAPENAIAPVAIEAALSNKLVKANAPAQLVARIGLSTERRTSNVRPPVNVALLVDTSGSMDGRAIEDARAASLALLGSLSNEDRLAVVVFHSKAEVLLPSTRIADANMDELKKKIGAMKAQGTTDMSAGLRMALDQVESNLVSQGVNRVILLGDGVPNDDRTIQGLTSEATSRGVSVTTLGLGNDYDEILMGRIAQQSGGKFSYVEDSSKVASFFKEEVVRLHRVVARNAVLEIDPGPGIVVQGVIGRPTTPVNRGVQVVLGDLPLGERQEIVVELSSKETKEGSTVEALDAVLRWQDMTTGSMHEERVFVGAKATADEARIEAGKDQKVLDAAARAKDAAATLTKLEQERNQLRALTNNVPAPSPVVGNPVEVAAGAGVAHPVINFPPKMPQRNEDDVRRAHQKALDNFQSQNGL